MWQAKGALTADLATHCIVCSMQDSRSTPKKSSTYRKAGICSSLLASFLRSAPAMQHLMQCGQDTLNDASVPMRSHPCTDASDPKGRAACSAIMTFPSKR